ncbi:DNA-binding transcriptional LysR family regulator [Streptomyces phaeochromogenes]|uniref:LysR substrate-binding domain-containing protein n=1 Tax=Streptomyces TaxID=1883 RepID=UPI0011816D6A|nr:MULTISPECIES: LysR substrate-binding domain-containing protein [Streptomyces]MDQ0947495.1 DNA-binding transcriptional LysR family regulator [Streptomyces phaeochromogenes]TRO60510.1 LysR family transcriptional regulator [Streptomyces sp. IB201691-2A2]
MTGSEDSPSFRLAYVPGVTPSKWVRIWNERLPDVPLTLLAVSVAEVFDVLRGGDADAGFVRLPVDRTDLSAIPLYTETTVVVVPKDHVVAAVDEVTAEDLADDIVLHPLDDTLDWEHLPGRPAIERPATTEDAIELVAAGVGLLVVPQSLARLHHRKDLTYRTVTDAPESRVALSWPEDRTTDLVEDFIGIVRGRTVNSSRGRSTAQPQPKSESQPKGKGSDKGTAGRKSAAGKASGKPTGRSPRTGSGSPKGTKRGKPRRKS